jgi:hypothetical protein
MQARAHTGRRLRPPNQLDNGQLHGNAKEALCVFLAWLLVCLLAGTWTVQ